MLSEVSCLVGDAIFKQMVEFATEKLQQADWLSQYIGMVTLANAIKGPSSQLISLHCGPMWNGIFEILGGNPSTRLRYACS